MFNARPHAGPLNCCRDFFSPSDRAGTESRRRNDRVIVNTLLRALEQNNPSYGEPFLGLTPFRGWTRIKAPNQPRQIALHSPNSCATKQAPGSIMNKNAQKGRSLEKAVRLIQETILKCDPNLKGSKFSIECNKVVSVARVRHEIDIWVKTLPGSPYESICIFECKNWKEPVGKNEVIILSAKVNAVGANRGFLVARRFSKDAEAQAKSDPRLGIIECADDFVSPVAFKLLHVTHEPIQMMVAIKERGVPATNNPATLEWKGKPCFFDENPVDFASFVNQRTRETISGYEAANPAKYQARANHFGESSQQFVFEPGEFLIGSKDVEYMVLDIKFFVNFRSAKLLSKFQLKGQGRAFSFEPIESGTPGLRWEIDVVQRL